MLYETQHLTLQLKHEKRAQTIHSVEARELSPHHSSLQSEVNLEHHLEQELVNTYNTQLSNPGANHNVNVTRKLDNFVKKVSGKCYRKETEQSCPLIQS